MYLSTRFIIPRPDLTGLRYSSWEASFIAFIYVDYGVEEGAVHNEVRQNGFRGYHLAGGMPLEKRDLAPNGWSPRVPPQYQDQIQRFAKKLAHGFVREPFAYWYLIAMMTAAKITARSGLALSP
jgi:hypothetical protein